MAGNKLKQPNPRRLARFHLLDIMNFYPIPISRTQAIHIMKITDSTWRRYMAGTANPNPAAVELLRLHAAGRIMPDSFTDCYFHEDKLIDDYGKAHTLGDLRVHQIYAQKFHEYMAIQRTHNITPKPREIGGETLKPDALPKQNVI